MALTVSACSNDLDTDPYTRWAGIYDGLAITSSTSLSDSLVGVDTVIASLEVAKGLGKRQLVVLGDTLPVRTDGGYEGYHSLASYDSFRLAFFPSDSVRVSYLSTDGTSILSYQFRGKKRP